MQDVKPYRRWVERRSDRGIGSTMKNHRNWNIFNFFLLVLWFYLLLYCLCFYALFIRHFFRQFKRDCRSCKWNAPNRCKKVITWCRFFFQHDCISCFSFVHHRCFFFFSICLFEIRIFFSSSNNRFPIYRCLLKGNKNDLELDVSIQYGTDIIHQHTMQWPRII